MEYVGFVAEPSCGRGTASIVWSCLATIFFVVWTTIHIDYRQNVSRIMWGIAVFVMPEAMPAGALQQLLMARRLQKRLQGIRGWDSWSLEQSFLVVKNGIKDKESGDILTADRLIELAEKCQQKDHVCIHIDMLPQRDEISRRSKKSWFEKIVAGGQAVWFSANVISRVMGGYQVTLMEDVTMAYACCGLIAMAAWIRCPQDIEDPFEVVLRELDTAAGQRAGPSCNLQVLVDRCMSELVILSLLVVTGVHLAAWQYPFPSAVEAWIWRSCALSTLPLGSLVVYFSKMSSLKVTCPLFAVARLALWTVACTAFRRMPVTAFDTPDWSNYWGHIGN